MHHSPPTAGRALYIKHHSESVEFWITNLAGIVSSFWAHNWSLRPICHCTLLQFECTSLCVRPAAPAQAHVTSCLKGLLQSFLISFVIREPCTETMARTVASLKKWTICGLDISRFNWRVEWKHDDGTYFLKIETGGLINVPKGRSRTKTVCCVLNMS